MNGDYEPILQDLTYVQKTLQLLSIMTNNHRFEEVYETASDGHKDIYGICQPFFCEGYLDAPV